MPRPVKTPDGAIHNFPDDATDAEISEALGAVPQKQAARARTRTWTDTAVDALPMVGGAVGGMLGTVGGPLGAMGGAAIGGAGGEAWRQNINRMRGVDAPATPTEAAKDIGIEGGTQAALEGAGSLAMKGLSAGGRAIYRGYLKPSLSARLLPKATEIVETGIREAMPVSEAGAARTEALATDLRQQVEDILKNTPGEVNLHDVANRVRTFAKRKYFIPGKPIADYEAAMKVADELDNHAAMAPTPPNARVDTVDLPTANTVKRGLDETVGESNFGVDRGATKTAQKVARRGMRDAIEAQAPGVGALNARESRLIDLGKALNRATGREANRNALFGVPSMASLAGGAEALARGTNPYAAAAMTVASRAGLSPVVATRAAILAAKMGDKVPGTAVADVARVALTIVSEAQNEPESVPPEPPKNQ